MTFSMSNDPGLICFQHKCSKTIFCKTIPNLCPSCNTVITSYVIEPFRVPYPCSKAQYHPTAVVLRPANGSFLHNYESTQDLHIGVTNSEGKVFEFDKSGLIVNDYKMWNDCVVIKFTPSSWDSYWDQILSEMAIDDKWNKDNYHATEFNCFTFIGEFLNILNYKNSDDIVIDKEKLCEILIKPNIDRVVEFIHIYRHLENNLFYYKI